MRMVVVLDEAAEDIERARDFYDAQELGIGDYCADSLLADIESLVLYHGIHWDKLGLLTDEQTIYRHERTCACKCKSVSVRFIHGGDGFQWAWRPPTKTDATDRYGSDMVVVWKVEGDPRSCEFHQDERGQPNVFIAVRENPPGRKRADPGKDNIVNDDALPVAVYGEGSFTYIDFIGVNFRQGDEGTWNIDMDFTAVLKCVSSDGKTMSKSVPLKGTATVAYPK